MRLIVRIFAILGLLSVLITVGMGVLVYRLFFATPTLPDQIVLKLELTQPLLEQPPEDPFAGALLGPEATVRDIVSALDRARTDDRVKGLVVRIAQETIGMAQAQELRAAVQRFRESGRFALVFAESFGGMGAGNQAYYLASGFDEVWLQPLGTVGLIGFGIELPFARDLLDRVGVQPQIATRKQYKTAMESLTASEITEPHREMLQSMLDDLQAQLVAGIAQARSLSGADVAAAIDRAPLLDKEAETLGLIDRIGYLDELVDTVTDRAGEDSDFVTISDYLDGAGTPYDDGTEIALVYAVGAIQRGKGGGDAVLGQSVLGADTLAAALRKAAEDEDVKAVVLRIDSPGGSAVASESIRRAVVLVRDAGKPVIVSMANAAASGGYWIAMNADRIIAEPATFTGSIGVFGGKVATAELWEKLNINWAEVKEGDHATMFSQIRPFSPQEQERVDRLLDDIYDTFVANVAEGRGMAPEAVEAVAKGRVWTGRQAVDAGLVDQLGDLYAALDAARALAGLAPDAPIELSVYPRPVSALERALDLVSGGARSNEVDRVKAALSVLQAGLERSGLGLLMHPPEILEDARLRWVQ